MLRNIRNIFSLRGVRFVLPLQGVSRFATPQGKKTRILRWTRKEADAYEN